MSLRTVSLAASTWLVALSMAHAQQPGDWPTYGRDTGGQRYSPLTQITPDNVAQLTTAWTVNLRSTLPPDPAAGRVGGLGGGSQFTPLVVDGVMYVAKLPREVVAIDVATGKELWSTDVQGPTRAFDYWPGNRSHPPSLIFTARGGLFSLNAKTGKPNPQFGNNGSVTPAASASGPGGGTPAPVLLYKNLIISSANPYKDGREEDIRAFDIVTGKQVWRFSTIPRPGEFGADTWPADYARRDVSDSAVGMWGQASVDVKRGIVYVVLDSPQWERWGGDRLGDNLFGDSIVALKAETGKYLWHYQVVRHDLWDMDLTGQPVLFDAKQGRRTVPAVAIVGKPGLLFMFNRVTGKPLYDIVETPVAKAMAPGEVSAPTQPIPSKPVGIARTTFAMNEFADLTPEHTAACRKMIEDNNVAVGGPYNPPGWGRPSLQFPGANGAGNYGGFTVDPKSGYLFVNTQDLGQITQVGPRGEPRTTNGTIGRPAPRDAPSIPYDMTGFNGRFAVLQPVVMPCQAPPWGRLSAVNVNTGEIAWQVPLGITEGLPPEKQLTGRPNLGGPISTATGLVFIGASDDQHFRAFDAKTGKTLWDVKLDARAGGTPISFAEKSGRQYVAVAAGGTLHVFALPAGPTN